MSDFHPNDRLVNGGRFCIPNRRLLLGGLSALPLLGACETAQDACPSRPDGFFIADALKELLLAAVQRMLGLLGRFGGFGETDIARVGLPETFRQARSALNLVGAGARLDEIERTFNRAAEVAAPRARGLFDGAVAALSFEDPVAVLKGAPDAATQTFARQMSRPLVGQLRPVVENAMAEVGALGAIDDTLGRISGLPGVQRLRGQAVDYVLEKSVDGMFKVVGREEAAIRNDRSLRLTPKLSCVFDRFANV